MNEKITDQEAIREAQREYFREWRKKNKDKVRQHNRNYWEKKARQRLESKNEQGGNA